MPVALRACNMSLWVPLVWLGSCDRAERPWSTTGVFVRTSAFSRGVCESLSSCRIKKPVLLIGKGFRETWMKFGECAPLKPA